MSKLLPVIDLAELTIVPSYACRSANCIGCYKKTFEGYFESCKDTLDINILMPFLRKYISTVRVYSFGITGGEPTEYNRICDLVRMLTAEFPGIRLEIVSNGQNHFCIGDIIEAANGRSNMQIGFSIDGYGPVCDLLRGKKGYFSEVLLSVEQMAKRGRIASVQVNTRYYPEHEDSIIKLSHYLYETFGITRNQFSLGSVTYRLADHPDAISYITVLRTFASRFWNDASQINIPHTPSLLMRRQPYNSRRWTSFCSPAVHPNGQIYTCDTQHGLKVGDIRDDNVVRMVARMLHVATAKPEQCDSCLFGQCVLKHYEFQESLSCVGYKDSPGNHRQSV